MYIIGFVEVEEEDESLNFPTEKRNTKPSDSSAVSKWWLQDYKKSIDNV